MTKYNSANMGFFLVDGYSILGYQTDITVKKSKLLERSDTLGDSWEEQDWPGLSRAEFSQKGFYDDGSDANDEALMADVGTSRVLCLGYQGNTIGLEFIGFAGTMQVDYNRLYQHGQFTKAEAMYQGDGAIEEGVILHTHSTESAASGDTESSPVDNGASSADGGSGYFQVSALTLGGYDGVTLKVRDSADDITYADLVSGAFTSAPDSSRVTVAGTVDRYLASSWAYSGSGSGQSVTFMVGFYRN